MKKPIFIISTLFLLTALLMANMSTPILAHSGDESSKHTALYNVTNSSETVNTWFNSDFSESYQYVVEENSEIEVELDNPTDVNTELNITIGNLTRTNILDTEADGALAFGYWNMSTTFGFVANNDWTAVEDLFNQQNFTTSSFMTDQSYQFGAATFTAVEISFYDGFQNTTLIYNQDTGLLYNAYSIFFGYELGIEITGYIPDESNDVHNSSENETPIELYLTLISMLSLVLMTKKSQ